MRSPHLRLSPKYGVNPCMPVCFWCGEPDGTVALLGLLPGDAEAPRHPVVSHEPCPDCQSKMDLGITIMEAIETIDGTRPTGSWLVVTEDAVRRMFHPETLVEQVLQHRKAFMDREAFRQLTS